ncbi:MAG TPA: hypothetical protein VJX47_10425 [Candidatus Sulfotelmatobacter sp.]|nr:hypothetical protein [Candidatus Sulfotelmatobacter sp.]
MIAKIDNGNANKKRPQKRLAIAMLLVCAGKIVPSAGSPTAGGDAETAETSLPHTLQNLSPTGTLFPQAEQNKLVSDAELGKHSTPRSHRGQSGDRALPSLNRKTFTV